MREQLKDISAIIGQRLNTACRMWKGSVSPDISIVYSEDSVNWHNYLLECFSQIPDDGNDVTPLTVNSIMLETQEIPVAKKDAEALASSRVQLIILSPDFLDFVTSNSGDVFHVGRLLDPDRIVAMLCGVEPTDVNDVHRSALVTYDFWKNKLSVVDQDKDFVIEVLKKTAEILCDVNGVHNNKSKSFRVTPRHVTRDKNKMYILLNKPIINVEKVKVTLHRRDEPDDDSGSTKVNVKIINPYTIQFYLAGSSVSSVIDVRVTCDDVDLGRQPICCVSRMGELARLLHTVTSSPVEFMYQSLGLNSDSHHVLDRHLTDGIKKHQACLGKLSLVDFDVDSCERLDRCEEMPTLLHFAARYGFAELCSALLDCIGATVAYQITDVHGMTAADVARSVGHNDIADTLAEFQSVCEANGIYLNLRRNDAKRQDATDAEDGKTSKDVINIQLNDIPYMDCDEYVEMVGTKPENIDCLEPHKKMLLGLKHSILLRESANSLDADGTNIMECNDPNNVRSNISNSQYELIQILEEFKKQNYSIGEVELLFQNWLQTQKNSSVREKEEQLKKMRQHYDNVQRKLHVNRQQASTIDKCRHFLASILGKNGHKPTMETNSKRNLDISAPLPSKFCDESTKQLHKDMCSMFWRLSTASSSSSSSVDRFSCLSHDSGNHSDIIGSTSELDSGASTSIQRRPKRPTKDPMSVDKPGFSSALHAHRITALRKRTTKDQRSRPLPVTAIDKTHPYYEPPAADDVVPIIYNGYFPPDHDSASARSSISSLNDGKPPLPARTIRRTTWADDDDTTQDGYIVMETDKVATNRQSRDKQIDDKIGEYEFLTNENYMSMIPPQVNDVLIRDDDTDHHFVPAMPTVPPPPPPRFIKMDSDGKPTLPPKTPMTNIKSSLTVKFDPARNYTNEKLEI